MANPYSKPARLSYTPLNLAPFAQHAAQLENQYSEALGQVESAPSAMQIPSGPMTQEVAARRKQYYDQEAQKLSEELLYSKNSQEVARKLQRLRNEFNNDDIVKKAALDSKLGLSYSQMAAKDPSAHVTYTEGNTTSGRINQLSQEDLSNMTEAELAQLYTTGFVESAKVYEDFKPWIDQLQPEFVQSWGDIETFKDNQGNTMFSVIKGNKRERMDVREFLSENPDFQNSLYTMLSNGENRTARNYLARANGDMEKAMEMLAPDVIERFTLRDYDKRVDAMLPNSGGSGGSGGSEDVPPGYRVGNTPGAIEGYSLDDMTMTKQRELRDRYNELNAQVEEGQLDPTNPEYSRLSRVLARTNYAYERAENEVKQELKKTGKLDEVYDQATQQYYGESLDDESYKALTEDWDSGVGVSTGRALRDPKVIPAVELLGSAISTDSGDFNMRGLSKDEKLKHAKAISDSVEKRFDQLAEVDESFNKVANAPFNMKIGAAVTELFDGPNKKGILENGKLEYEVDGKKYSLAANNHELQNYVIAASTGIKQGEQAKNQVLDPLIDAKVQPRLKGYNLGPVDDWQILEAPSPTDQTQILESVPGVFTPDQVDEIIVTKGTADEKEDIFLKNSAKDAFLKTLSNPDVIGELKRLDQIKLRDAGDGQLYLTVDLPKQIEVNGEWFGRDIMEVSDNPKDKPTTDASVNRVTLRINNDALERQGSPINFLVNRFSSETTGSGSSQAQARSNEPTLANRLYSESALSRIPSNVDGTINSKEQISEIGQKFGVNVPDSLEGVYIKDAYNPAMGKSGYVLKVQKKGQDEPKAITIGDIANSETNFLDSKQYGSNTIYDARERYTPEIPSMLVQTIRTLENNNTNGMYDSQIRLFENLLNRHDTMGITSGQIKAAYNQAPIDVLDQEFLFDQKLNSIQALDGFSDYGGKQ